MHGIHGSDHHLLALVKSTAPGFHHCSWDVASVNDIGLGAMRMHDKGWTKGWGLGRHVLGSNYFHYVRDPWGSFSEYSCDIDYIPKEERWPSADHKPEDSFYLWGPDVPREFTINYEAARAELDLKRRSVMAGTHPGHFVFSEESEYDRVYSTTILTLSPGFSLSCGPRPLSTRKRSSAWSDVAMRCASFSTVSFGADGHDFQMQRHELLAFLQSSCGGTS